MAEPAARQARAVGMSRSERMKFYRQSSCCFSVLVLVLIILLSSSFGKLEYYEMGFKQRKSSGTVYREKTFQSGRHWIGPDFKFVVYPSSVVNDYLHGLEAWTRATVNTDGVDGDAGTAVTIDVGYQYRLIPEELDELYTKVGVDFRNYIRNIAINVLKNNATRFSSDDFIMHRRMVESEFRVAISGAFASKANAALENFQLRNIGFPKSFMDRKLAGAIQILKNDAETYRKQATLTRAETTKQVLVINNEARQIQEEARAEATFTKLKAVNQAAKLTQNSRHEGLKILAEALNITKQDELMSLDYMFAMLNSEADIYVNFDTLNKMID